MKPSLTIGDKVLIAYNRSGVPCDEVGEVTEIYISGLCDVKLPSREKVVTVNRHNLTKYKSIV